MSDSLVPQRGEHVWRGCGFPLFRCKAAHTTVCGGLSLIPATAWHDFVSRTRVHEWLVELGTRGFIDSWDCLTLTYQTLVKQQVIFFFSPYYKLRTTKIGLQNYNCNKPRGPWQWCGSAHTHGRLCGVAQSRDRCLNTPVWRHSVADTVLVVCSQPKSQRSTKEE